MRSYIQTILFPLFILLSTLTASAQDERVYLTLSKYSCLAGDTIAFKAYIRRGQYPSSLSTNLYLQLFTDRGIPLTKDIFPLLEGEGLGQLKVPDSLPTASYYLRAFTRYQLNDEGIALFTLPLLVYNKDKPGALLYKKEIRPSDSLTTGFVNGLDWTTSTYKGQIVSLLILDSAVTARKLHLVKPILRDSSFIADITLDNTTHQRSVLFPTDTSRDLETLLLYEDSTLIGRQFLHLRSHGTALNLVTDTLDTTPYGYNSWQVSIPDSLRYVLSISVTDADRSIPPPTTIARLQSSSTEDLTLPIRQLDTSFISFTGKATRESGKKIKDPFSRQLMIAGSKDSNFLFTRVVSMDDPGNFTLDSLFFFGQMDLQFQLNKAEDGSNKNVHLDLAVFTPPPADTAALAASWEDTALPVRVDTVLTKKAAEKYALSKVKNLAPVVVKGWKNPRKELDDKYTTGAFSEPALYSFDVRTDTRWHDLGDYLRANFGRFQGGFSPSDTPRDMMGHPFLFFVDEQNYTWPELQMFDWQRIAYIKCFESDFIGDDDFIKWKNDPTKGFNMPPAGKKDSPSLSVPVSKPPFIIAIYTRKGTDFRTMPGGLNKITVNGYTPILKFHSDATTLYWEPLAYGNQFRIMFNNNADAKRFRVVIEGVNHRGETIHYEKILYPT